MQEHELALLIVKTAEEPLNDVDLSVPVEHRRTVALYIETRPENLLDTRELPKELDLSSSDKVFERLREFSPQPPKHVTLRVFKVAVEHPLFKQFKLLPQLEVLGPDAKISVVPCLSFYPSPDFFFPSHQHPHD